MALRSLLLVGLLLFAAAAQAGPRQDLVGRWRSDRATTLANLAGHPRITQEQRALLEEILGQLVIEYRNDSYTARLDDWTDTAPYTVVAEGPDFVDVRAYDAILQRERTRRVWVKDGRMWLWSEGIGFHEYFERIP